MTIVEKLRCDQCVRGIDDARIGLTELHLGQDLLDVVLVRDHVGEDVLLENRAVVGIQSVEYLDECNCPTGTASSARTSLRPGRARSCKRLALHPGCRRQNDDELVGHEGPGCTRSYQSGGGDRVHLFPVSRGEHIGLRALFQLCTKVLRSAEVENNLYSRMRGLKGQADLVKRIDERRRGEHGQIDGLCGPV